MGVGGMYHLYKGDVVGLSNRNTQAEESKVDRHQGCPRLQTQWNSEWHLIWPSQWAGESTNSETETHGHTYLCWEPHIQPMMGREFFSVITWVFSWWQANIYSQRHLPCRGLPGLVNLVSEPTLYPGAYGNICSFVLLCGCQAHEEKETSLFCLWGAALSGGKTCREEVVHGERAYHLSHDVRCCPRTSKCIAWQQQSPWMEWSHGSGRMGPTRYDQAEPTKPGQKQIGMWLLGLIITEALVNAIKSNTYPGGRALKIGRPAATVPHPCYSDSSLCPPHPCEPFLQNKIFLRCLT